MITNKEASREQNERQSILHDLHSGVPENRMRACIRAASLRDTFLLDHLIALTHDTNIEVCETACSALAEFSNLRVINTLCNLLGQANTRVQEAAMLALITIGVAVIPEALMRIATAEVEERANLIRVLGELRATKAVPYLVASVADINPRIRMVACRALARIKEESSYEHIRQCLTDKQISVRVAACEALQELGDHRAIDDLLILLTDKERRVANAAFTALDNLGGGVLFRLSSAAARGDAAAIEEIAFISPDAITEIREPRLRHLLLTSLGNVKKISLASLVIPALDDTDAHCRSAACDTLGKFRDPAAVPRLVSHLQDNEPSVILTAMRALELIGDFRAIDSIITAVSAAKGEFHDKLSQSLQRLSQRVVGHYHSMYCMRCLHRFSLTQHTANEVIQYPVCRKCGKTEHGLSGISTVIAMMDRKMKRTIMVDGEAVRVNYFTNTQHFDFDAIEIVSADNYDIERFCVRIGNDGDPFRLARYPSLTCYVYSDAKLTEGMFAMLRNIFPLVTERFALAREIEMWRQSE